MQLHNAAASALLVADAPGHIIERMALAWRNHGRHRFDVVCSNAEHPWRIERHAAALGAVHWLDALMYQRWSRLARVPQVLTVHHIVEAELPGYFRTLPQADALVTLSRRWQARLLELTGRRATIVPQSVDTTHFRPLPDRHAARAAAGIAAGELVIGFCAKARSNRHARKGLDLLTPVLHEAVRRWQATVLLIGSGWQNYAEELRAGGARVIHRLPRHADETAALYPLMDVLLSTSREEGGPGTILEAMACGTPVITTDVGHVPELVRDGENGFVCAFDADHFLQRIATLHDDSARAAALAAQGRRTAVEERDDRVVLPRVDFAALYAEAAEHFRRRTAGERARRAVSRGVAAARYAARVVTRRSAAR
ncbi:MAG TPA: glycosyltransferase family 4 protein [Thermoanaerobaculia bacterium]